MNVRDREIIRKKSEVYEWLMRKGEHSKMRVGAGQEEKKRKEKVEESFIHSFPSPPPASR